MNSCPGDQSIARRWPVAISGLQNNVDLCRREHDNVEPGKTTLFLLAATTALPSDAAVLYRKATLANREASHTPETKTRLHVCQFVFPFLG